MRLLMFLVAVLLTMTQLPPDSQALPPPPDPRMVLTRPMILDWITAEYRELLRAEPADRRAKFESLSSDDRSRIMRAHLMHLVKDFGPTPEELQALLAAYRAATPAAYAGDASARKQLDDAERRMTETLSARVLAEFHELLPPLRVPKKAAK
jgi:hypothetical protein